MASSVAANAILDIFFAYLTEYDLKAMLTTSAFVFDQEVHEFRSDVTNEIAGTGYVTGGVNLTGVTAQLDTAADQVKIISDFADFGQITASNIAQIIVYMDSGASSSDRILSAHSFSPVSPNNEFFGFEWDDPDTTYGTIAYINY